VFAPNGIITLLTDFGLSDPFVGMMKGVILSRFPVARVVDLTHGVPPQDVAAGAFWLERTYPWFPPGTVHVAVVDPGVGTSRAQVVAQAHGHYFVAPDNGIIAGVAASDPNAEVRRFTSSALGLGTPSSTFHGRDLFAPVGADLASGRLRLGAVGEPGTLEVGPLVAARTASTDEVAGRVVVVDHFGNLITDIEAPEVARVDQAEIVVAGEAVSVLPLGGSYASVASGELTALVNAHGTIEIAVRDGNAATRLGVGPRAEVRVRSRPS
jgi:S-adenosylmethionine hydrolase